MDRDLTKQIVILDCYLKSTKEVIVELEREENSPKNSSFIDLNTRETNVYNMLFQLLVSRKKDKVALNYLGIKKKKWTDFGFDDIFKWIRSIKIESKIVDAEIKYRTVLLFQINNKIFFFYNNCYVGSLVGLTAFHAGGLCVYPFVVFNGLIINHWRVGGLLSSFWRDHFWTPTYNIKK